MSDTRFNSAAYLDAWKSGGSFPAIHTGLFNLVITEVTPDVGAVLDLGSSTGLMSRRLADAGYTVLAVEGSRAALAAGREAGTYEGILASHWRLLACSLTEFSAWVELQQIKIVVARRVFPELDDYGVRPAMLSELFIGAGVEHLFVEGRAPRSAATHRLPTLEYEIEALGDDWTVVSNDGPHRAHLVKADRTD